MVMVKADRIENIGNCQLITFIAKMCPSPEKNGDPGRTQIFIRKRDACRAWDEARRFDQFGGLYVLSGAESLGK
jgi:hypothetical protein